MGRKKEENGSAPSREKAHIWREAATKIDSPMRYWTMNRKDMNPKAPCFPSAS